MSLSLFLRARLSLGLVKRRGDHERVAAYPRSRIGHLAILALSLIGDRMYTATVGIECIPRWRVLIHSAIGLRLPLNMAMVPAPDALHTITIESLDRVV
jgi:hypothetical protein